MNDIAPKYQCASCRRGVLNRQVKHCLYCGAQLPAHVLATPDEIAAADQRARSGRQEGAQSPQAGSGGLADAFDVGQSLFDLS